MEEVFYPRDIVNKIPFCPKCAGGACFWSFGLGAPVHVESERCAGGSRTPCRTCRLRCCLVRLRVLAPVITR